MKTDRITYLIFLYHTDSLSEEEEKENPPSRSAKLRVVERI